MSMSKVTELDSREWSLESEFPGLSQANNTPASFSSTSYVTRGHKTHWKVRDIKNKLFH